MVHHSAAKFVSNSYPKKGKYEEFSITKVLQNLNWDSLEKRREQARLTMAFKILNGDLILDPSLMPKMKFQRPVRHCTEVKVGFANQLVETEPKLDVTKSTFFYATPKLWNDTVTPMQANAPNVDSFKRKFKK